MNLPPFNDIRVLGDMYQWECLSGSGIVPPPNLPLPASVAFGDGSHILTRMSQHMDYWWTQWQDLVVLNWVLSVASSNSFPSVKVSH